MAECWSGQYRGKARSWFLNAGRLDHGPAGQENEIVYWLAETHHQSPSSFQLSTRDLPSYLKPFKTAADVEFGGGSLKLFGDTGPSSIDSCLICVSLILLALLLVTF